jgi:hypothetical protein
MGHGQRSRDLCLWKMTRLFVSMFAGMSVLLGCTPTPSSGPTTWPEGPPGYIKVFWQQGDGPRTLGPSNSSICGLIAVSGRFAGPGEWVLISIDANGNWVLNGASQQNSVSAEAACVLVSAFLQPNGMQWTNGSWTQAFTSYNNICFSPQGQIDSGEPQAPGEQGPGDTGSQSGGVPYNCPVNDQAGPLWGGDSVCYLTGFGGFHLASGESVAAEQFYKSGDPTWYLHDQAWDLGQFTWGGAACVEFFNLQASAPHVSLGVPEVFKPSHAWFYAGSGPLPVPIRIANKNNAFCVLSMVGGGFFGGGETIRISGIDTFGRQQLSGTSFQAGTRASAVCIYYDQVNPPNPGIEPFQ